MSRDRIDELAELRGQLAELEALKAYVENLGSTLAERYGFKRWQIDRLNNPDYCQACELVHQILVRTNLHLARLEAADIADRDHG